jgi:hypothetical protein
VSEAWQLFYASSAIGLLGWSVTLLRSIDAKFASLSERLTKIEANCPKCNYPKQSA